MCVYVCGRRERIQKHLNDTWLLKLQRIDCKPRCSPAYDNNVYRNVFSIKEIVLL